MVSNLLLLSGLIWTYYLGYSIGIIITPRFFKFLNRKFIICLCTLLQGILILIFAFTKNIYLILILRIISGFIGTIDIIFKELIDDISTQNSRTNNLLAIILCPRNLSLSIGISLSAFFINSDNKILAKYGNILSFYAILIFIFMNLVCLLFAVLIKGDAIKSKKAFFQYAEFESILL